MMRVLHSERPQLVRLCEKRLWTDVEDRSSSHPHEAAPSESSLRGQGSTALSAAVRSAAPLEVIRSLAVVNRHQIAITNQTRGSLLHEAIKHLVDNDVCYFLLEEMIQYQQSMRAYQTNWSTKYNMGAAEFKHVSIQDQRVVGCTNLLAVEDDLDRTALHCAVERFTRSRGSIELIRRLVVAYPAAVARKDSDGNTPLILLLLGMPRTRFRSDPNVDCLVQLMLEVCPESALVTRSLPRPWRFQHSISRHGGRLIGATTTVHGAPLCQGNPTALYYAILNGHGLETIQRLLSLASGHPLSAAIVTDHHEVALHVAVTTRAPLSVLFYLLYDHQEAIGVIDCYGLSPLDWLWIRYVMDCHTSPMNANSTRTASRRRSLPHIFLDWYNHVPGSMNEREIFVNPVILGGLRHELMQKIKLFLPVAASVKCAAKGAISMQIDDDDDKAIAAQEISEGWTLLHALCAVPCPLGMLRTALYMDMDALSSVQTTDCRFKRLPLHYACDRPGYSAIVPVGISHGIERIQERSAAFDIAPIYPEGCCEADCNGQLPLHITIDTFKRERMSYEEKRAPPEAETTEELELFDLILRYNPAALDHRDGKTGLYPWQQAAVGPGASVDAVYSLFRAHPMGMAVY